MYKHIIILLLNILLFSSHFKISQIPHNEIKHFIEKKNVYTFSTKMFFVISSD